MADTQQLTMQALPSTPTHSFEAELQSLRLRLSAEHQMQLERADAGGWLAGWACRVAAALRRLWKVGTSWRLLTRHAPHLALPCCAARREDAARLAAAAAEYEQRLAAARAEWEAEKSGLAAAAAREAERVRREFESGQVSVGLCVGGGCTGLDAEYPRRRPA